MLSSVWTAQLVLPLAELRGVRPGRAGRRRRPAIAGFSRRLDAASRSGRPAASARAASALADACRRDDAAHGAPHQRAVGRVALDDADAGVGRRRRRPGCPTRRCAARSRAWPFAPAAAIRPTDGRTRAPSSRPRPAIGAAAARRGRRLTTATVAEGSATRPRRRCRRRATRGVKVSIVCATPSSAISKSRGQIDDRPAAGRRARRRRPGWRWCWT